MVEACAIPQTVSHTVDTYRGLLSPVRLRAFNDLLPCAFHLRLAVAVVDMPSDGGTDMHRTSSWILIRGHGGSDASCFWRCSNGKPVLSAPDGERCAVHMTCLQSLLCHLICGFPHDLTLVQADYAMIV